VWALGCILYEVLCGHQAFPLYRSDNGDDRLIYGRIKRGEFSLTNYGLAEGVSGPAKDLLKGLLEVDPTKRLSATEALKHPWIAGEPETRPNQPLTNTHESLKHKLEERRRREEERRARRNQ
jgi:serine/threonine protein kinase